MVQLKCTVAIQPWARPCCSNSCIVQLKCRPPRRPVYLLCVLIPVWCNWNLERWGAPFHGWIVLIPVWCNWNTLFLRRQGQMFWRFNSCMVQLKCRQTAQTLMPLPVLIPVWCNWNTVGDVTKEDLLNCFNSCMVQLKLLNEYGMPKRFPEF